MKKLGLVALLSLLGALLARPAEFAHTATRRTNAPIRISPDMAEVAKLSQAGIREDVIRAFIRNTPRVYRLSADDILNLQKLGVAPGIITTMLEDDDALGESELDFTDTRYSQQADKSSHVSTPQLSSAIPSRQPPTAPSITSSNASAGATAPPPSASKAAAPSLAASRPIVVDSAPPPPRLELVPLSPGPEYFWVRGHWTRHSGAWAWTPGVWVRPPWPGAIWLDGRWARHCPKLDLAARRLAVRRRCKITWTL